MIMHFYAISIRLASTLILLLNTIWMWGQKAQSILDNFYLFEVNGKVQVYCTITSGKTCQGIEIWRKTDRNDFEKVGHIKGICGSVSSPVSYSFTDENPPKNETLIYKLYLGGYGYTDVREVWVSDLKELAYKVIPNPARDKARIYINTSSFVSSSNTYYLNLYNHNGNKLITVESGDMFFELNVSHLNNGVYYFDMFNNEIFITFGKIYVNH